MSSPRHTTPSVEEAVKTLSYKAALQNDDPVVEAPSITGQELVYSAPYNSDELPGGCAGITTPNRNPGTKQIDVVYDEDLTQELYDALFERAKWFMRVYITPGRQDHFMFFFESTCNYNIRSQEVSIPGVIRGPDAIQDHLPTGMDPVVTEGTYLVPIHQLPDRYWERSQKCSHCTLPHTSSDGKPWFPRTNQPSDRYDCPVCNTAAKDVAGTTEGTWFLHDAHTGGTPEQSRCGPVPGEERYKFMDWLLNVEPGDTTTIPEEFPEEPATLSDGTVVDWLSPLEPVTDVHSDSINDIRPFITVQPPEYEDPLVISYNDLSHVQTALSQQSP